MEYPNFKVCCRCFTFNQAKYITDTMNGFTMQQTDFPFVCTIVDDASTDGEQDVIRNYVEEHFDMSKDGVAYEKETEYANIIYAQHKTNANCYFAVLFLKENHYSKGLDKQKLEYISEWRGNVEYEALCEGDDYWIDPSKLNEQVQILEENIDVSMVHCDYTVIDRNGNTLYSPHFDWMRNRARTGYVFHRLIRGNYIQTLTCCFRKSGLQNDIYRLAPVHYDYTLFMTMASLGKIVYVDKVVGHYRRLPTGAIGSSASKYNRYGIQLFFYFSELFLDGEIGYYSKLITISTYTEVVCRLLSIGKRKEFRKQTFELIKRHNVLLILLLPAFFLQSYRALRWKMYTHNHKIDDSWKKQ